MNGYGQFIPYAPADSSTDVAMGDIELDNSATGAAEASSTHVSASGSASSSTQGVMRCQCPVVVDGANVALSGTGADDSGSWEHCDISRIQTVIRYYRSKGLRCFAFLPQFWAKPSGRERPWNPNDIKKMVEQKLIVLTPAQTHDDHFIIGYAKERDGFVVTNDMFRDHIAKADNTSEQEAMRSWCSERIIPYTFVGDEFVPEPSKMTNLNRHVSFHGVAGCPNANNYVFTPPWTSLEGHSSISESESRVSVVLYPEAACSMDLDTEGKDIASRDSSQKRETNATRALRESPIPKEDMPRKTASDRKVKVDKELENAEKESKASFLQQLEQADLPPFFYEHFCNVYSHIFQNAQMRIMAKIRKAWREHAKVEKVDYTSLPETVDAALPTMTLQVTTRFLQRYMSILKEEYDDGEISTQDQALGLIWGSDIQNLLGEEATKAVANAMYGS
eukprot:gb/GECG01009419.1/.p1 GENE.gb/GECG01009419.1/~~gb/GECG01009419.1/.p1  ORF type:complete len:449 (+),score=60.01 gb/GECG01009419.1/:1-1347(+)